MPITLEELIDIAPVWLTSSIRLLLAPYMWKLERKIPGNAKSKGQWESQRGTFHSWCEWESCFATYSVMGTYSWNLVRGEKTKLNKKRRRSRFLQLHTPHFLICTSCTQLCQCVRRSRLKSMLIKMPNKINIWHFVFQFNDDLRTLEVCTMEEGGFALRDCWLHKVWKQ